MNKKVYTEEELMEKINVANMDDVMNFFECDIYGLAIESEISEENWFDLRIFTTPDLASVTLTFEKSEDLANEDIVLSKIKSDVANAIIIDLNGLLTEEEFESLANIRIDNIETSFHFSKDSEVDNEVFTL